MSEEIKNDLNASAAPENTLVQPGQTTPAPDPYADIKLTENSLLRPETLAVFKQAAADVKLPATCLQQWVDAQEELLQQAQQQTARQKQEQLQTWAHQTQQDFGPNWQQEVSRAVRAADAFGGPQLRALLEETGLGNHPVIVRTFHAVASRVSEDLIPGGASSTAVDKTFAQALYGKN